MKSPCSSWGWLIYGLACGLVVGSGSAWAGQLEDLLLQKKEITIDEWVQLKAEEEKRQGKALEESRGVGDAPVSERWYEKISIRGYAQFRYNKNINNPFLINEQGDRAIGDNAFSLRRARVIISGQPHDRVFVYLQPEFASAVGGAENVAQIRDWYADLFLTENKEWRIRAGQSKVPFGFENMQSSQNRLGLDRDDAINSAAANERDLGVFLYYAPTSVRERFRRLVESGLKGSGDYGMLGIGVYNGQTANRSDRNGNKHVVFHSMYPHEFANGQILEVGMDAYTGQFVVSTAPVMPRNPSNATPAQNAAVSPLVRNNGNYVDERVAWHFVLYPQPFGLQGEYTVGRGPELNAARTEIVTGSLRGGYLQLFYNYKCDTWCLNIFPFIRHQEYYGGKKHEDNAPRHTVRETEVGLEYQFSKNVELTVMYTWTQRTSAEADTIPVTCLSPNFSGIPCTQTPYQLQTGNLLRFQLQWSF
ncbi:MAG: porin [Nitrospiraceae bacterium]